MLQTPRRICYESHARLGRERNGEAIKAIIVRDNVGLGGQGVTRF